MDNFPGLKPIDCDVHPNVPGMRALMPYLDLDDTRPEAAEALVRQASSDADMTNSRCGDPNDVEGQLVRRLFMEMPERAVADPAAPLMRKMGGA